jgi:hypothetical protein
VEVPIDTSQPNPNGRECAPARLQSGVVTRLHVSC